LGGWGSVVAPPFLVTCVGLECERQLCQSDRAGARRAGVVRSPVVRNVRPRQCDRVLGVIPIEARCAGVVPCRVVRSCRCGKRA
jgi:hypothetical protein